MRCLKLRTGVGVLLAGTCLCGVALAQDDAPKQGVGVLDEPRPYYDPKGIPLGGFRLFPGLGISNTYDDNIFRLPSNTTSDNYVTISPTMRLQSQWGLHFLELYGGLNSYNYVDNDSENLTDWNIGTDGRLDIVHGASLTGNLQFGELHELWSSPNNVPGFQLSPNQYFETHAQVIGTYQPEQFGVSGSFTFDRFNWTRTPLVGGGFLSNDDRDEDEYEAYIKAFYDFSPGYSAFVKYSFDGRSFDQLLDRSGSDRSSNGYHIGAGVDLQLSDLISGEVLIGYLQQFFSPQGTRPLKDVSGLDYNVQLDWFVRPDLTVHLIGTRTLTDVVLQGVSVADDKVIGVSAEYEFQPDIILQGKFAYTQSSFIGTTRSDDYPSIDIGGRWLINRYASLNLNYTYSDRSSNVSFFNYTDNMLTVGLKLQI